MNCFSKWFLPYRSMIPLILSAAVCTNAQTVSSPNAAQSWTASSQTVTDNANPSRTTESHTKSGNRTVDKKTVEVLGPNGQYQPSVVTETETIQEDAKTTRSITRTYNPDADGHEQLTQVTESETRNSADSGPNAVRTTSNLGADGSFHIVEREITKTTNGSGSQVTQTTVYLPDMNGSLAPSMEIHEQQRHGANGDIQTTKTTLLPDGKGGWRVQEVQERTVTGDAENRTTDERVSRRDFEGKVESLSGGTGASFSLLPPDNASGNYVKVVQRVPVRVSWNGPTSDRIAAGASAEVTVYTK